MSWFSLRMCFIAERIFRLSGRRSWRWALLALSISASHSIVSAASFSAAEGRDGPRSSAAFAPAKVSDHRVSCFQSDPTVTNDQPNRVSIAYIPPINSTFQELHDVLRDHLALEKAQETR